ncbi:hypothetical protein ABZ738_05650 [Micromonospora sp. NPDC047793]|uniref:hypothetical protein n=1 Tax=Micromonospora sp. NPDC047793 TaxID=3154342 RepID=UPI0033FDCEB4
MTHPPSGPHTPTSPSGPRVPQVTPLDPDSPEGLQVTADLSQVLAEIELAITRRKADQQVADTRRSAA